MLRVISFNSKAMAAQNAASNGTVLAHAKRREIKANRRTFWQWLDDVLDVSW